jgi:hypothetical protein
VQLLSFDRGGLIGAEDFRRFFARFLVQILDLLFLRVGEIQTDEELSPTAGADSFSGFSGGCGRCGRCGCGGCAPPT